MKLKNIFTLISFLIVAVSCSMEDDVLNEITKSDGASSDNVDKEMYFALSGQISVADIQTRANESLEQGTENISADKIVTYCSMLILDGDKVLDAKDGLSVTGGTIEKTNFLLKAKNGLEVYFIANSTQEFKRCTSKSDIEAVLQDDGDLATLVKMNSIIVNLAGQGYSSTAEALNNPVELGTVTLLQLTARIELDEFVINGFNAETKARDVVLKSIELLNVNTMSLTKLDGFSAVTGEYNYVNQLWKDNDDNAISIPVYTANSDTWNVDDNVFANATTPVFYTFPNFSESSDLTNRVAMKLTISVDGREIVKEFVINRPEAGDFDNQSKHLYVKSGYLYKVKVNATLTSNSFDCDIVCCVKDWKYNEYEVTMQEL